MPPASWENLTTALAAFAAILPTPKARAYRESKHGRGRRTAKGADKLRKSRRKMAEQSRRRNRR